MLHERPASSGVPFIGTRNSLAQNRFQHSLPAGQTGAERTLAYEWARLTAH
jgi:hypothetical protein